MVFNILFRVVKAVRNLADCNGESVLVSVSRLTSSLLRLQGTWPEVVVALGEVIMTCWHTADISVWR